jgi:hypothetical protein
MSYEQLSTIIIELFYSLNSMFKLFSLVTSHLMKFIDFLFVKLDLGQERKYIYRKRERLLNFAAEEDQA